MINAFHITGLRHKYMAVHCNPQQALDCMWILFLTCDIQDLCFQYIARWWIYFINDT